MGPVAEAGRRGSKGICGIAHCWEEATSDSAAVGLAVSEDVVDDGAVAAAGDAVAVVAFGAAGAAGAVAEEFASGEAARVSSKVVAIRQNRGTRSRMVGI